MAFPRIILSLCLLLVSIPSEAVLRTFNFTIHSDERAPDGFSREVYLINGQQPGPLIEVEEGDDLEVFVQNDLSVETTIHWHGLLQRGTPQMDGVPGVTQYPIPSGGNFTYRFSSGSEYGFYWYHSHFKTYYDDAVRGPLLIRPKSSRRRPFDKIVTNNEERDAFRQAESAAIPLMLTDWYHQTSNVVYEQYLRTGAFPHCFDSLLANGHGRVQCLPERILAAGPGLGVDPPSVTVTQSTFSVQPTTAGSPMTETAMNPSSLMMSEMKMILPSTMPETTMTMAGMRKRQMSGMSSMGMNSLDARGCTPPMMFNNGFNMSSLPPQTCSSTTSPLLMLPANHSLGWLALNIVNAGSVSKLSVSIDGHSMMVYAADGLYVEMQEARVLEMSIGQRYSILVKLDQIPGDYLLRFAAYPWGDMQKVIESAAVIQYDNRAMSTVQKSILDDSESVYMYLNGSVKPNVPLLDPQQLAPSERNAPPSGAADVTKSFKINQTDTTVWVVNGTPYREASTPVIFGNASEGWNADTTLHMPSNATIDIIMTIAEDSMDSMGHPMHLHGHKFWVLGLGKGAFPYQTVADAPPSLINLDNPPYRDSVELPSKGWVVLRYVSDNPGTWLFHCHVQWHLASGMAMTLVEGEEQFLALQHTAGPKASVSTLGTGLQRAATGTPAPNTSSATILSPIQIWAFFCALFVIVTMLH